MEYLLLGFQEEPQVFREILARKVSVGN